MARSDLPLCFLTGASGFVGANLAPLLAERYRLRCLLRPGQAPAAGAALPHERVDGTLADVDALRRGVAVIVHHCL